MNYSTQDFLIKKIRKKEAPMKHGIKKWIFISLLLLTLPLPATAQTNQEIIVDLLAPGFDTAVDSSRNQIYVSIPTRNEIAIISINSFEILDRIVVGSGPKGIDLSHDNQFLYIALSGAGAVAILDLASQTVSEVVVGNVIGNPKIFDVAEGKPDRVFVSANPGSSGLARIAMIKRDENNAVVTVANNRFIRSDPSFGKDPNQNFIYVAETSSSPNSVYKLDLSDDTAPIVLEDAHGTIPSGAEDLQVSPDGMKLHLKSGLVLRTENFIQAGVVGNGHSKLSEDGLKKFVASSPNLIEIFDTTTFLKSDEIVFSCSLNNVIGVDRLSDNGGTLILGNNSLCVLPEKPIIDLTLSPPSGEYTTTQDFDLAVLFESDSVAITDLLIAEINGTDIISSFATCNFGALINGGQTIRCPDFGTSTLNSFGPGTHNINLSFQLSDGSTLNGTASWEVHDTFEP